MNSKAMKALVARILSPVLGVSACCVLATSMYAAAQAKPKTAESASPQQRTFATAQQAAEALVQAIGADDVAALNEMFGPDGKDIVSTGDDTQDKNARSMFAKLAAEKKHVDTDPHHANRAVLSVGAEDWPFPVPLVKQGAKWHFDAKAGHDEIVARRIGGNELDAINICRGYVEAQKEYASEKHDGSEINQYAEKIISSPGKQDGLYWQNADGSPGGPIGEAIAKVLEEGYKSQSEPYHGYHFKILKGQGPAAPLGELDYKVGDVMIGGFALVAWPADYRVSGVQTFIVGADGIVYQKDLGPDTAKVASEMERYNPDKTWQITADEK